MELRPGRLREIADELLAGGNLLCHSMFYAKRVYRQPCAGAIIFLEKQRQPNTLMQVMDRMGAYPRASFMRHQDKVIEDV